MSSLSTPAPGVSTTPDATTVPTPTIDGGFRSVAATRSYEEVVRQIEHAIRSDRFSRNARLPTERQLAESFGVSRGVIREAVKVLGAMGLVEARQGSGLYVRNDPIPSVTRAFILSVSPDAESLDRLFEFRRGLEVEAATFAAARRTDADLARLDEALEAIEAIVDPSDWQTFGDWDSRFHLAIADASGNPYLAVAIATARDMQRDVVKLFVASAGSMRIAIRQHRAIHAAIAAGDADAAGERMAEHITYTSEAVQSRLADRADAADAATTEGVA